MISITESENGFCQILLTNGEEGEISVSYKGTIGMKVSFVLTLIGIMLLVLYAKKRIHFL